MFGVKHGFDIVIGNPPYLDAKEQLKKETLRLQRIFYRAINVLKRYIRNGIFYIAFIEIGITHFCCEGGLCVMIVPYPLSNQLYAQKIRRKILDKYDMMEIVDLNGVKVFENATVTNCIPFIRKSTPRGNVIVSKANRSRLIFHSFVQPFDKLVQDEKTFVWNFTI